MSKSIENPFFSRDRIFKVSRIRVIYFLIAAAFYVMTEVGRFVYRPYIYRNAINDLGFADVVGNLLGTIVIIFTELTLAHATKKQGLRVIVFVPIGVTLYELAQFILPKGVLDWKDVAATPIAGLFALGIFLIIWKSNPVIKDSGESSE